MMLDVSWGRKKRRFFPVYPFFDKCCLGNNLHPVTFQKLNLINLKLVSLTVLFLKTKNTKHLSL